MIAIAAAVCAALLAPGTHTLECTAYYLHNEGYQSTTNYNYTSGWTQNMQCAGEGHPYKVVMKDNGVIVCRDDESIIFEDGFEDGTIGAWG